MQHHYVWVMLQKIFHLVIEEDWIFEYVYDFSVDYGSIDVDGIHKSMI